MKHNNNFRPVFLLAAAYWCGLSGSPGQQGRDPRMGYVFPAGAQRGTTCEVVIGGRLIEDTKEILVTGAGVRASVVGFSKPLPQKRVNELRDYLQEARKKAATSKIKPQTPKKFEGKIWVADTLKEAGASPEEIRLFLEMRKERNDPKRQQNLQIAEKLTLKMEIAANAEAGPRELRVLTPAGVSNPLVFCIGNLPEQREQDAPDDNVEASRQVKTPVVLNGQILPGETDHFDFEATPGQRVVIAVHGRDLIPYLADAVPGWFQPVAVLYDARHRQVGYADDYRFGPDPVLCYDVREGGVHRLEIRDALYRGREDFVYRISLGAVPFVTGIFPLGGHAGAPASVDVAGWNLGGTHCKFATSGEEGIHPVKPLANGFAIGDVSYAEDTLPEATEREPNNDREQAQRVDLPAIVNGRIGAPGDIDCFSFACKAGTEVVAEVMARRLNSPLDSWLKITDDAGRQIAFNDDCEDKGSGLLTHHADSRLNFTAPKDGVYFARLGDAQHKGGPEFSYRLRISAPRPDFDLRVVPSAINARPGMSVPVTVYALRKDGFSGDIMLGLKDAPAGFSLQGACVPAGSDKMKMTLTCPQAPPGRPVSLTLEGRARIGNVDRIRRAVPADDMLQAFIYHHLVPARELLVACSGPGKGRQSIQVTGDGPVKLPVGGVGGVVISSNGRRPFNPEDVQAELVDPPDGIRIEAIAGETGGVVISFRTDAAKLKPGTRGNLIVEMIADKPLPPKDGKKQVRNRWSMGYLPAIPFEVTGGG